MGVLEEIMQMKQQNVPEQEIINNLQERGYSPKDINDAVSQAQVKQAVGSAPENSQRAELEGMQPSIMSPQTKPQQSSAGVQQYSQELNQQQYPEEVQGADLPPQQPAENYYQPQESPAQDMYGGAEYAPAMGVDTDAIVEISEQVFAAKVKEITKKLEDLNEFKTLSQAKIENINTRVEKIESIIDKLQIAILEKIGSYGEDLSSIKQEMSMMEDSLGKMFASPEKVYKSPAKTPLKRIKKKKI